MAFDKQILGTIISSMLDYDNLIKITGDPKVINPEDSVWIPADGRSITGSKLHEKTQLKDAPDLRGKFLRGLNVIYSVGQPIPFNYQEKGDPEGENRKVAEFQRDAFMRHSHSGSVGELHGGLDGGGSGNIVVNRINSGEAGGAIETRPRNIAVYYYIKIN